MNDRDLPFDALTHVFEFLPTQTLPRLSRVSSLWNNAASHRLTHQFSIHGLSDITSFNPLPPALKQIIIKKMDALDTHANGTPLRFAVTFSDMLAIYRLCETSSCAEKDDIFNHFLSSFCQALFRNGLLKMNQLTGLLSTCDKKHIITCMRELASEKPFDLVKFISFVATHKPLPSFKPSPYVIPYIHRFSPVDPKYLRGGYGRETYPTYSDPIEPTEPPVVNHTRSYLTGGYGREYYQSYNQYEEPVNQRRSFHN